MSFNFIRRRREEKLRRLREERESMSYEKRNGREMARDETDDEASVYPLNDRSWIEEPWEEDLRAERTVDNGGSPFLLKVVLSLFLFSAAYVIYHTETPFSRQGQQFIAEVMTREFNFQGVAEAIEQKYGVSPAILPTIRSLPFSSQPTWMPGSHSSAYLSPTTGDIVVSFEQDGASIQIATEDRDVKAIDQGWVIYSGETEENGKTVTIIHRNGTKSTYSGLAEARVEKDDWVQPGQLIGSVEPGSTLRFSMQIDEKFIDPTSVITFE